MKKVFKCPRCSSVIHELDARLQYLITFDEEGGEKWEVLEETYECPSCCAEYPSKDRFTVTSPAQLFTEWEALRMEEEGEGLVVTAVCTDDECGFKWPEIIRKTPPPCLICGCETRIEPYKPLE